MRRLGMFPEKKPKQKYIPKPYEQMTHPGERIQIDVKVVPRRWISPMVKYQEAKTDKIGFEPPKSSLKSAKKQYPLKTRSLSQKTGQVYRNELVLFRRYIQAVVFEQPKDQPYQFSGS
jgi:hypothetical protein